MRWRKSRTNMSFRKGSVVWYYDRVLKEWRKGNVIAINKHSVAIKKRHKVYDGFARYEGLVLNAAEPKPTLHPTELRAKKQMEYGYRWGENSATTRLLLRLGIYK